MTISAKMIKTKAQYSLDIQTAKVLTLSSGNASNHEFLTGKDVFPKKDLLEKAPTIKILEYLLQGKELKAQTTLQRNNIKRQINYTKLINNK